MKKKILSLLLAMSLAVTALAGCGKSEKKAQESVEINIGSLKGPTSIGLAKVLTDSEDGKNDMKVNYQIAAAGDELTPKLIDGSLDMAAIPANMASIVYNKTEGKISVVAINTLGVLYIVDTGDSVKSVEDLKGKTIYATGEGATPEYALRQILIDNGMNPDTDVKIEWKSEATEVVSVLAESSEEGIAMLPQPFVTVAASQLEGLSVPISLNDEWEKNGTHGKLVTGVLVVRNEFLQAHPETVKKFMDEYKASCDFTNTNVADAAALVERLDIVKAKIAEKAIPKCNITFIEGAEMKDALSQYLQNLFDQNPKSIGGKVPGDDFYYAR